MNVEVAVVTAAAGAAAPAPDAGASEPGGRRPGRHHRARPYNLLASEQPIIRWSDHIVTTTCCGRQLLRHQGRRRLPPGSTRKATEAFSDQHHTFSGAVTPIGVSQPLAPTVQPAPLTGAVADSDDVPRVTTGRDCRRDATTFGNNVPRVATGRRPARGGGDRHRRRRMRRRIRLGAASCMTRSSESGARSSIRPFTPHPTASVGLVSPRTHWSAQKAKSSSLKGRAL